MSDSFSVLLSSNVKNFNSDNQINKFTTKLPHPLVLDHSWQVAAANVHFPKTFYSFDKDSLFLLVATNDTSLRHELDSIVVKDIVGGNALKRSRRSQDRFNPKRPSSNVDLPYSQVEIITGSASPPKQGTLSVPVPVSIDRNVSGGVTVSTTQSPLPPSPTPPSPTPPSPTPPTPTPPTPTPKSLTPQSPTVPVIHEELPDPIIIPIIENIARTRTDLTIDETHKSTKGDINKNEVTIDTLKNVFVIPIRGQDGQIINFRGGDFENVTELCTAMNNFYRHGSTLLPNSTIFFEQDRDFIKITPVESLTKRGTTLFPFFTEDIRSCLNVPSYDSPTMFQNYLKWENGSREIISCGPVDLLAGYYHIFLYCNIVQSRIFGDTKVQRLKTLSVPMVKFGTPVACDFRRLEFVDLCVHSFEDIEVSFRFDSGKLVPFKYGRTLVELLFRKKIKGDDKE